MALRGDGGCPGAVQHQGDLPEVVGGPQEAHLPGLLAGPGDLGDPRRAVQDHVEVVAWGALFHHTLPVIEGDGLQGVSYGQALPVVQALQDGDLGEVAGVGGPLPDGGVHEDPPVGLPVDPPQLHFPRRPHRRRPWVVVYQRQLTERAALSETKDFLLIDVNLDLPLVDDVEVVALVALLDDDLPRHGRGGEHRVEDVRTLVLVQVAERDHSVECFGEGHSGLAAWGAGRALQHSFRLLGPRLRRPLHKSLRLHVLRGNPSSPQGPRLPNLLSLLPRSLNPELLLPDAQLLHTTHHL